MSFNRKPKTINPDEVDPSVYYYDEVYDEIKEAQNPKEQPSSSGSNKEKSKYIQGIIATAEERKVEKEFRKFRKIAQNREASEQGLDDDEIYITPAYKKKLDEMKKLEASRRRMAREESEKSMNFLKHKLEESSRKDTNFSKKNRERDGDDNKSCDKPNDRDYSKTESPHQDDLPGDNSDDSRSEAASIEESNEPSKPKRRILKTTDDRRTYLKEILAKRTVGLAYEEAVRRYKQRKMLS